MQSVRPTIFFRSIRTKLCCKTVRETGFAAGQRLSDPLNVQSGLYTLKPFFATIKPSINIKNPCIRPDVDIYCKQSAHDENIVSDAAGVNGAVTGVPDLYQSNTISNYHEPSVKQKRRRIFRPVPFFMTF